MVDHPHLSAGNSLSSSSRALPADLGVSSPPGAPSDNDLPSSSDARMLGCEGLSSPLSSSSSENSLHFAHGSGLNPVQVSEIFRAAQQLTSNDRTAAAEVRKQNLGLIAFIEAMGHSMDQVHDFLHPDRPPVCVHDDNTRTVCPSLPLEEVNFFRPELSSGPEVPSFPLHAGDGPLPASSIPENLNGKRIAQSAASGPSTRPVMGQTRISAADSREAVAAEGVK